MKYLVITFSLAYSSAVHLTTLPNGSRLPYTGSPLTHPNVVPDQDSMATLYNGVLIEAAVDKMAASGNRAKVPSGSPGLARATTTFRKAEAQTNPAAATLMITLPNGAVVPADTPAVSAAKAAFLRVGGEISHADVAGSMSTLSNEVGVALNNADVPAASGRMVSLGNGAKVFADTPSLTRAKVAFPQAGGQINPVAATTMVTLPNGAVVPADTPALARAKAAFRKAGGEINPAVAGSMVTHPNGAVVPSDTPALVAAKAAFYRAGGKIDPAAAGSLVTLPNGAVVPADTHAVAAAKAAFWKAGSVTHPAASAGPEDSALLLTISNGADPSGVAAVRAAFRGGYNDLTINGPDGKIRVYAGNPNVAGPLVEMSNGAVGGGEGATAVVAATHAVAESAVLPVVGVAVIPGKN